MRAAVIIKDFLHKEQQSQNGSDLLKGATYLGKLPVVTKKEQKKHTKRSTVVIV